MIKSIALKSLTVIMVIVSICALSYADEKAQCDSAKQVKLDMVSDTVSAAFAKTNALLNWNLDITMSPEKGNAPQQYTVNAIGQKVPKATAVKSASSLHNDQPL